MSENQERSTPMRLVNLSNIEGKVNECAIFNISTSKEFTSRTCGRVWVTQGGSVIKEERANGEFYLLTPQQALRWFMRTGQERSCPHDIMKSLLIK